MKQKIKNIVGKITWFYFIIPDWLTKEKQLHLDFIIIIGLFVHLILLPVVFIFLHLNFLMLINWMLCIISLLNKALKT